MVKCFIIQQLIIFFILNDYIALFYFQFPKRKAANQKKNLYNCKNFIFLIGFFWHLSIINFHAFNFKNTDIIF
jgi:hypothetical protein